MTEYRCRCWGWAQADAHDLADLIDNGHRKGCPFRVETDDIEVEWELDEGLAAEILATYDEEDGDEE